MRKLFLYVALMGAAACGSLAQNQPFMSNLSRAADVGSGFWQAERDPRPSLTRAQIDASPNALLLFAPVNEEVASVYALTAINRGKMTWASDKDDSLTLQNGLIVATRGLGGDLMGADLDQVYRALLNGNGSALRIHAYLDGEDQIQQMRYTCEIATLRNEAIDIVQLRYQTRLVRETCTGEAGSFRNLYWIDAGGMIRQSRQWVSVRVGAVDLQML